MVVVFLNCFLRSPGWLFHDKQSQRIELIPKYTILDNNTIIGLCEVFGNHYGKQLKTIYNKHNYNFIQARDTSSGLAIAFPDTYKLVLNGFIVYKHAKFPDNLANKGFMHCCLQCKNCQQCTHVIITHLQCAYEEDFPSSKKLHKYRKIQKQQLLQLFDYIKQYKLQNYILMGDFNIDQNISPDLFKQLVLLSGYQNKLRKFPSTPTYPSSNTCIDYIFTDFPTKSQKIHVLDKKERKILNNNKHLSFISDHKAIALY